ncbi:unknown [Lactobacillus phage Lb338-1]|uniref:Uncharacterized protein n=1 Tax=Lactobacillus phage Lb338-1 TaxID=2892342 RepID=C1KFP9_9CAUD|nr:hypothetical protein lb338_phage_139 [Lactobacillus phage Lb338-1]ACO37060.1 unknown [Lactobacillus phage Lb338-1]
MHKVYPHTPLRNPSTYKLLYHAQERLRTRSFPGVKDKGPTNFVQDNLNAAKYFGRPDTSGLEFWGTENITFLLDTTRHVIRTIYEPSFALHTMPEEDDESDLVKTAKAEIKSAITKAKTHVIKGIWGDLAKDLVALGDNYRELGDLYNSASRINRPDQLEEKLVEIADYEDKVTAGNWKVEDYNTDVSNINSLADKAIKKLE